MEPRRPRWVVGRGWICADGARKSKDSIKPRNGCVPVLVIRECYFLLRAVWALAHGTSVRRMAQNRRSIIGLFGVHYGDTQQVLVFNGTKL